MGHKVYTIALDYDVSHLRKMPVIGAELSRMYESIQTPIDVHIRLVPNSGMNTSVYADRDLVEMLHSNAIAAVKAQLGNLGIGYSLEELGSKVYVQLTKEQAKLLATLEGVVAKIALPPQSSYTEPFYSFMD